MLPRVPGAADAGTLPTAMRAMSEALWPCGNSRDSVMTTFCFRRKNFSIALDNCSHLTLLICIKMCYKYYLESESLIFFSELLKYYSKKHLKLSA